MARKTTPPPLKERLGALLASPLGGRLLRLLGVACLVLVAGMVVKRAKARAWRLDAYRLRATSVRFEGVERDVGERLRRALLDPRRLAFDVSVFDAGAEDAIRSVVASHPCVAEVESVAIRYPDRVGLRVRIRRPAAWFEVRRPDGRRGYVLVSKDACLLDPRLYADLVRRGPEVLPKVTGVRAAPPRGAGRRWEDLPEQVAEGLAAAEVARRLAGDFNGTLSVEGIDVSAFPARPERRRFGEVRLRLHDGTIVEWGRTERDLEGVSGEDPYAVKRWRLERELGRSLPVRRRRIDVRFRLPGEGEAGRAPGDPLGP